MSDEKIKFDKKGNLTKESKEYMEYLFRTDRDKFMEMQEKHFTTKAKMKDNPFKGMLNKIMKGKKDAE